MCDCKIRALAYTGGMGISKPRSSPEPAVVLGKALLRAAERLGLSRQEMAAIVGRDRSSISRSGVDPDSKAGELALLLIRSFRPLAVIVDDSAEPIRASSKTRNKRSRCR